MGVSTKERWGFNVYLESRERIKPYHKEGKPKPRLRELDFEYIEKSREVVLTVYER